jgi:hypothetical protein
MNERHAITPSAERPVSRREPYVPPKLVELGTLAELTAGHPPPDSSDITFAGSGLH